LLLACSFEHGMLPPPPSSDAPPMPDAPVDAKPADARVCPPPPNSTCRLFTCPGSNSCYYECGITAKQSWTGARGSCPNANLGCIVTINDQAEQNCITAETVPSFPSSLVWFGWKQDPAAMEPDQGWGWECPPSSYVSPAWGSFEPNNTGGNEDCGALTDGGGWIDADCSGSARFVCELP
jgi:hypothetical protein